MPPPSNQKFEFAKVDQIFKIIRGYENEGLFSRFLNLPLTVDLARNIESEFVATFLKKLYCTDGEIWGGNQLGGPEDPIVIDRTLGRRLGYPDTAVDAIRSLFSSYVGQTLDSVTQDSICWRLAAGFKRLSHGQFLEKDFIPYEQMWVPMRIEDCTHGRPSRDGKPMLSLIFRIYDGVFAGLSFKQNMPYKYVMYKLARDIGFQLYQKLHRNELGQANIAGLLQTDEEAKLIEFYASSGIKTHNRNLRKLRSEQCLRGFEWGCHQCSLGFTSREGSDFCPRATHSLTYVKKECSRCKDTGLFDPASRSPICVGCATHDANARIKRAAYSL